MTCNPNVRRLAIVAALVLLGSPAFAQEASPPRAASDPDLNLISQKLRATDKLTIRLDDGTTVKGRLETVAPEGIVVVVEGKARTVPASRMNRIEYQRRSMKKGAILGGVIGAGCGIALAAGLEGSGGFLALVGAGVGTGLGLGIDAAVNFPRTVYKRQPPRLGVLMQPGRLGIQAAITF